MSSPARVITNTGTKKNIGRFFSQKMQTTAVYESLLERDYMYLLEIDPEVKSYSSQPLTISYSIDKLSRRYTPDFLVERISKTQIVEVKPIIELDLEENTKRFEYIAPNFEHQGWEFVVVTDKKIRVEPLLSNVKLLYRYKSETLSSQQYLSCQQYFKHKKAVELQIALQDLEKSVISRKSLYKLLFVGFLETDLMQPIGSKSYIRLSNNALKY
jgi:TnsA endonuclease N terminal